MQKKYFALTIGGAALLLTGITWYSGVIPAFSQGKAMQCMAENNDSVWIEGGSFIMGEDKTYPEERLEHKVTVDGFWIDRHEVTNKQFAKFVAETGYITVAERQPDTSLLPPNAPSALLNRARRDSSRLLLAGKSKIGGCIRPAPIGGTLKGQEAILTVWRIFPSSKSHLKMHKPMQNGRGVNCPQRHNMNLLHAAAKNRNAMPGAVMKLRPAVSIRPIYGRAHSPLKMKNPMDMKDLPRSDVLMPMIMAFTT